MDKYIQTPYRNTLLITICDKKTPITDIINTLTFDKDVDHIIIDLIVRFKQFNDRFVNVPVNHGHADWFNHQIFEPDGRLINFANQTISKYRNVLDHAELTNRQINAIHQNVAHANLSKLQKGRNYNETRNLTKIK